MPNVATNPKGKNALNKLKEEYKKVDMENIALFDSMDNDPDGIKDETIKQIESNNEKLKDLGRKMDLVTQSFIMRENDQERLKGLLDSGPNLEEMFNNSGRDGSTLPGGNHKSVGDELVSSPEWKSWFHSIAPGGLVPSSKMGDFGFRTDSMKLTAAQTAPWRWNDQRQDIIGSIPFSTSVFPNLLDLLTVIPTSASSVQFIQETSKTNAAVAIVELAAKPESNFVYTLVTEPVSTIAHWIKVPRQAVEDSRALRGYIDNFLREGAKQKADFYIIQGNRTTNPEQFNGILNVANTQTQAWSNSMIETLRKARTKVLTPGYSVPTAYVLNPLDWEALDLAVDGENRFYFGGPREALTPRLWGLPVIETEAMPAGTGVVGDWRQAIWWDREQAVVRVSDSDQDDFTKNRLTLLGEIRGALSVLRPPAFVEADLTAA